MNVSGSSPLASASHHLPPCPHPPRQVLDYDYYGAYGQERHRDYTYNRLLGDEYTFDFPPHHDIVSAEGQRPPQLKPLGTSGARVLVTAEPVLRGCFAEAQREGKQRALPKTGDNVPKRLRNAWPMLRN